MSLSDKLRELAQAVDRELDQLIPKDDALPDTLHRAMRYSVFAGGKRVRPALAMLAAEALGLPYEESVAPASALELIHTYSLIHDDLPAMDDDDLRRGKPSNHKVFGEATAILAGDALFTLAFEVLATRPDGAAFQARRADACALIARAAGAAGMVGGQELDLRSEGMAPDLDRLRAIHERKTCALLRASVVLGAVLADADSDARAALDAYGSAVGLAFQITDDILDVSGTEAELGKTPGKDVQAGKMTYPALLGLEESRARARELARDAVAALEPLGPQARWLEEMARYIVDRVH